ncbi:MAG: hypothetical protein Kapaf2KO_05480 [Candidatus Kapaibacteriales bacterium]
MSNLNPNTDNNIFHTEEEVLRNALDSLTNGNGSISKNDFEELVSSYAQLLKVTKKLTKLSDNSQRKLIKTQDKLEEASEELKKNNKELSHLNATKDKFFSIISHDLRNPIASVLMMTELLTNHLEKLSQDELRNKLGKINNAVDALYALFENLHRWSLSQSGQMEFEPQRMSVLLIAKDIYSLLKAQAENKNIAIELDIDPESQVFADQNMLSTILRNLISNAIKFTEDGGRISVSSSEGINETTIRVVDTGTGIPEDKVKTLFEIGKKNHTKGTNRETGSGLGLVVCKEFIDKHSGTIKVESKINKGSEFTITLPSQN